MSTPRRWAALVALFLAVGLSAPCGAQEGEPAQVGGIRPSAPPNAVDVVEEFGRASLLDTPIDRDRYLLGPGDVVDLAIFGEFNDLYRVPVTPEGTVVIPTIGVADVLGTTLNEAQRRVRDLVLRDYQNVAVRLSLARIREFKVFVVGDVLSPGVRIASAATRVSEVLPVEVDSIRTVLPRNVLLRRANSDTLRVDLARFRLLGDLDANPTLREGDVLVVPAVDKTVDVTGRVLFPGLYEFRPGETLAQLLRLANGGQGFPADAADTVRLARYVDRDQRRFFTLSRAESLGPEGERLRLEPFDAIYIARVSDYKEQRTAAIRGEVLNPGTYPVIPGTTTVRDLVALAGGFSPDASLTSASLRRQPADSTNERLQQLQRIPPELLSSQERRILQAAQGNDRNVVIDFQQLFAAGEDAFNQVLQDGDTLIIPEHRDEVLILGAVREPGIVQHVAGKSADYFVSLAGGYTRQADRGDAVVVKAGTGNRIDAEEVTSVAPGDAVVVPFRARTNYLQTLQTVSTVVTTVTGLILTFLALRGTLTQ